MVLEITKILFRSHLIQVIMDYMHILDCILIDVLPVIDLLKGWLWEELRRFRSFGRILSV